MKGISMSRDTETCPTTVPLDYVLVLALNSHVPARTMTLSSSSSFGGQVVAIMYRIAGNFRPVKIFVRMPSGKSSAAVLSAKVKRVTRAVETEQNLAAAARSCISRSSPDVLIHITSLNVAYVAMPSLT